MLLAPAPDHDVRTGFGETDCEAESDAGVSAGDERHLSRQVE